LATLHSSGAASARDFNVRDGTDVTIAILSCGQGVFLSMKENEKENSMVAFKRFYLILNRNL
jgi:hypothetical protein